MTLGSPRIRKLEPVASKGSRTRQVSGPGALYILPSWGQHVRPGTVKAGLQAAALGFVGFMAHSVWGLWSLHFHSECDGRNGPLYQCPSPPLIADLDR